MYKRARNSYTELNYWEEAKLEAAVHIYCEGAAPA